MEQGYEKMRNLIPLFLAALAGACTPPTPPIPTSVESIFPAADTVSLADGQDWTAGSCEYNVTFSGTPTDVSKSKALENVTEDDHAMQYQEQSYVESARCQCYKDRFPSQVTKYQALTSLNQELTDKDMIVHKSSFSEVSPLGKYVELEGKTPSALGDLTLRLKAYLQKKCLLVTTAISLTTGPDTARAIAFLNSTRDPRAPKPMPIVSPVPQRNDAASRLRALKDLLDQNLITPVQYNAERQSIIDGM